MSVSSLVMQVAPQTGCAFSLRAGQALQVIDIRGQQVADLAIYNRNDVREYFSAGRTLDYNGTIALSTGAKLFSNRSNPFLLIEEDNVKVHDYLLTPCSARMFEILHGARQHPSCHDNLVEALARYGIASDNVHATFNAFMRVDIAIDGSIRVGPPASKAGDSIVFRTLTDVVIGLTACSSEHTNNGNCKPIGYRII